MGKVNRYARTPDDQNTFLCLGQRTSYLVNGEETCDTYAIIEQEFRKGLEPPAHVHRREEETFYVVNGELTVTIGETSVQAAAGSVVVLPRGIKHAYTVVSETAKVLITVRPSGFETFFKELSTPLPAELPPLPVGPPSREEVQALVLVAAKY